MRDGHIANSANANVQASVGPTGQMNRDDGGSLLLADSRPKLLPNHLSRYDPHSDLG
jgi:hypothetical protein